jgi:CheY-like chemotaxis protein
MLNNMEHYTPTILLVDDDQDLLALMTDVLEQHGYRVHARTDAPGNAEIAQIAPALIFMDIGLKNENGAALCHAIKRDAQGIPVVLISGHDDAQLHQEATAGLADDRLHKPFTAEDLLELAARYAGVVNAPMG